MDLVQFQIQIDTTPKIYFTTEICSALNQLDEAAELFRLTVADTIGTCEDCVQLKETESWSSFVDAVKETGDFWRNINPANRPYDFGWCQSHLALHTITQNLIAFASLYPSEGYVGDISLFAIEQKTQKSEIISQFKSLISITKQIDAISTRLTGKAMPTLFDVFEP